LDGGLLLKGNGVVVVVVDVDVVDADATVEVPLWCVGRYEEEEADDLDLIDLADEMIRRNMLSSRLSCSCYRIESKRLSCLTARESRVIITRIQQYPRQKLLLASNQRNVTRQLELMDRQSDD